MAETTEFEGPRGELTGVPLPRVEERFEGGSGCSSSRWMRARSDGDTDSPRPSSFDTSPLSCEPRRCGPTQAPAFVPPMARRCVVPRPWPLLPLALPLRLGEGDGDILNLSRDT